MLRRRRTHQFGPAAYDALLPALRATNGQQLAEAIEVALAFANDGPRLIECAIDPDGSFDLISWGRDNPL